MRFNLFLFSSFLFTQASIVLAYLHHKVPLPPIIRHVEQRTSTAASNNSTFYSSTWSGALLSSKTDGMFTSVAGTFTVPHPTYDNEKENAVYIAAIIDGTSCAEASFLAGIYMYFIEENKPTYTAWYAISTDQPSNFTNVNITAGDVVQLNVTMVTPTSGFAIVENLTNGDHGNMLVNSTIPLCRHDAGWIVLASGRDEYDLYPLANFYDVTFSGAVASGPHGDYSPAGGDISIMKQGDRVLTSVSSGSDNTSITIHRL